MSYHDQEEARRRLAYLSYWGENPEHFPLQPTAFQFAEANALQQMREMELGRSLRPPAPPPPPTPREKSKNKRKKRWTEPEGKYKDLGTFNIYTPLEKLKAFAAKTQEVQMNIGKAVFSPVETAKKLYGMTAAGRAAHVSKKKDEVYESRYYDNMGTYIHITQILGRAKCQKPNTQTWRLKPFRRRRTCAVHPSARELTLDAECLPHGRPLSTQQWE